MSYRDVALTAFVVVAWSMSATKAHASEPANANAIAEPKKVSLCSVVERLPEFTGQAVEITGQYFSDGAHTEAIETPRAVMAVASFKSERMARRHRPRRSTPTLQSGAQRIKKSSCASRTRPSPLWARLR